MAVQFKGGFKIGGVEHHHPFTSEDIKFILHILKSTEMTGGDMDNYILVTMKLQDEYVKVKEMEKEVNVVLKGSINKSNK